MSLPFIDAILQLLNMLSTSLQTLTKPIEIFLYGCKHYGFWVDAQFFFWQHLLRKQKTLYMTAVHWKTAMNMEKKIFMIFIFNISSGYLFFRWDKICKIIISIICKDEYIIFESLHEWFIQLQPNMNTIV